MKRSSSAPCLAEDEVENQKKRIKACDDKKDDPSTREYLQLALARVLELQRSLNDDTYFNEDTSDLGYSDDDNHLMRHVLTKVFRDLPGSSSPQVERIIERATSSRYTREMERIRGKGVQLSGYDTCRQVAVDFMKKSVKIVTPETRGRRRTIDDSAAIGFAARRARNYDYEVHTRMLKSLDLHLAAKQRDYTVRLMRH